MSGWPTMEEVEQAPPRRLLLLNRHLPPPATLGQEAIAVRVHDRLAEARVGRPLELARASRELRAAEDLLGAIVAAIP